MSRKVFGALGQLSFSLGMFSLVFGITTVICVSLIGVFTQTSSFAIFLEATYFQFTSGPFDLFSRFQIAFMTIAVSFGVFNKCFNLYSNISK